MSLADLSANPHTVRIRTLRQRRRAAGLCIDCGAPCAPKYRCRAHAIAKSRWQVDINRRYRERRDAARAAVRGAR